MEVCTFHLTLSRDDTYFFAIDNVDFAEDTYDGQYTLHGAAMAIYQRRDPQDDKQKLR